MFFTLRRMLERLNRLALVLLLATAVPAWAATLVVTNSNDSGAGSLRGQIAAAATGDTIVFSPALDGATIDLTTFSNDLSAGSTQFGPSAFFITGSKALVIDATANGLTQGVVIARSSVAGTANFRLFDVGVGSSLTLRGVTLSNGYAEGGYSRRGGGALGAGGAIFNQGTLTLDRCTLTGNTALGGRMGFGGADNGGGGVGASSSTSGGGPNGGAVGVYGSTASPNAGPGGNGGFGGGGGQGGQGNNTANGNGGAGGNGGFGGGGGVGYFGGGTGTDGAGGNGGFGGGAGGGTPAGLAGFGGGASASGYGGAGAGMGGAIFNDAGTVTLTNVTLSANSANGGANGYAPSGRGSGYGGAIFNYAGAVTLDFVTLSGNNVAAGASGSGGSANGGAIYSLGDSAAACSAGGNTCATSGNARLTMNHSIAADSTAGVNDVMTAAINGGSSTGSGAGNLVGSAAGTLLLSALPAALTGGMADVMIPQAGSVAINAAGAGPCSSATDQRGIARPQGAACDVGAVEVAPANQAALTAIATPASIPFNATSALSTTGGSGTGAVSYAVTAGNTFCAITGSTLTGTAVGTCTVTATKAADVSYNAATATVNVTVGPANQTALTAIATPASIPFNATSALSTTGGSGTGAVSYAVTAGNAFCAISGSTLTGTGVGTCTVTASKAADANYNATTATENVTVGQAATAMTLSPPASIVLGQTVNVSAAVVAPGGGTPTGTVMISDGGAGTGDTCTITLPATSCALTPSTAGNQTLTATYSGDSNFTSSNASTTLAVGPRPSVAVPTLSAWMLVLLGILLAGLGATINRQRPPVTGR